jgi:hypothetical protein
MREENTSRNIRTTLLKHSGVLNADGRIVEVGIMKKEYPNIDGICKSQKQGIILTITRKSITIETFEPEKLKVIDADAFPQEPAGKKDLPIKINAGIQLINDIFWGPDKK